MVLYTHGGCKLPVASLSYGAVLLRRQKFQVGGLGNLGRTDLTMSWLAAGEAEEDGYEDEYQLEDIDIGAANYIKAVPVSNFRKAWEDTDPASEISDDYGLGVRDSLQVSSRRQSHTVSAFCNAHITTCEVLSGEMWIPAWVAIGGEMTGLMEISGLLGWCDVVDRL